MNRNNFTFIILFICSLFILSCSSNKIIPIPGESEAILNNIYIEYSSLGDSYYEIENYTKAATYYEMAMKNRKLYWSSYYKLAKCYALSSNWSKALPMYEKILKRDPDNSSIKSSLAYIYIQQGELKKAEKIYKELLETEPDNYEYIENFIAILMPDEILYKKNVEQISELVDSLQKIAPESENLKNITRKIESYKEKEIDSNETESDETDSKSKE